MAPVELGDRRLIREATVCSVVAVLLTIAVALPVVRHPSALLFGPELVGRHHDPYTVIEQYQAGAVPPPYLQPATDLPGMLLARVIGPVRAYNALLLVTFPLAAFFAYAHARHISASKPGAVVAALLFAFSPVHFAHAGYHVHIAQVQWVPLAFLSLWRLLDRPTLGRAVWLCLAVVLAGTSSFYLGLVVGVTLPIAALSVVVLVPPQRRAAAAVTAGALVVALAALGETVHVATSTPGIFAAAAFPLSALAPHSARVYSYLAPSIGHPWLGSAALAFWRSHAIGEGLLEQQVTIGTAVLTLAAVPYLVRWPVFGPRRAAVGFKPFSHTLDEQVGPNTPESGQSDSSRCAALRTALVITGASAVLLSIGPRIDVGPIQVAMPSRWLYAVAPIFRSYARFGIVVSLAATTMAGVGFGILFERRSRTARTWALVLLAIAVFEYLPSRSWRNTLPTMGHEWLASRPAARALDCVLPSPGATAGLAMLMHHDVSFLAGPFMDCAEPALGEKLAAFHYTHVLVRRGEDMWPWIAEGRRPDGTRLSARFADSAVFEVTAREPNIYVSDVQGFFPREFAKDESWRWMPGRGSLTVVNRHAEAFDTALDAELESFGWSRIITVTFDGKSIATVTVERDRRWHPIAPLRITPGAHVIAFRGEATAVSDVVPTSRDNRRLSIRLGRWRWRPVG